MANVFDPSQAPEGEPVQFTVGDFLQWKRTNLVDDYPLADYSAEYVARITHGGSTEFKIAATETGGTYLFTVDTATSGTYTAGHYHWQLEITQTSSTNKAVVDFGDWQILPDLDDNQADPRTHAEIMLNKIQTLLQGKADSDVSSYSVQGRSLTKLSFQELEDARDKYQQEVNKEKNDALIKRGKQTSSTIKVRF